MPYYSCTHENDELFERGTETSTWKITEIDSIDLCVSDVTVDFSIISTNGMIFVAYYDSSHNLKLAKRSTDKKWIYHTLDEKIDYDSHKYISMTTDQDGYLHLSANMHASALIYYKSQSQYNIEDLEKMKMIGENETQCTYPTFLTNNNKLLIFHYRDGYPGNAREIFNCYSCEHKLWFRLLDTPLFDGMGKSNAYMIGPKLMNDNLFHVVWCWRDTPDCSTNHGLYHATSVDLKNWTSINGSKVIIPITPENDNMFIIDDIPVNGGLLNIGFNIGYDLEIGGQRRSSVAGLTKISG